MWTMLLVSDLSFDIVSVLPGQLFLSSSRDEDITISFQNVPLVWLRVGEAHNGTMLLQRKHKYIKKQFKFRNKGTFSPGNQKSYCKWTLNWPVCSPPALWGPCRWGSRCCHRFQQFPHTWHHNGGGNAWNADPHYQNPAWWDKKLESVVVKTESCFVCFLWQWRPRVILLSIDLLSTVENKHLCHNNNINTGNGLYWEAYSPHQRNFWQDVMSMNGEMHIAAHITKGQAVILTRFNRIM